MNSFWQRTLCCCSGRIFINEFHYDNTGGQTSNQAIEVAMPAGTQYQNLTLVLYNGQNAASGVVYRTTFLSNPTPDTVTVTVTPDGLWQLAVLHCSSGNNIMQKGSNDGIALLATCANGNYTVQCGRVVCAKSAPCFVHAQQVTSVCSPRWAVWQTVRQQQTADALRLASQRLANCATIACTATTPPR